MSKKSEQKTSVVGLMVFNMAGSTENTLLWCSECGDVINNVEYHGDIATGKLKLGGICKHCSEKTELMQENGFDADLFQMMSDI